MIQYFSLLTSRKAGVFVHNGPVFFLLDEAAQETSNIMWSQNNIRNVYAKKKSTDQTQRESYLEMFYVSK